MELLEVLQSKLEEDVSLYDTTAQEIICAMVGIDDLLVLGERPKSWKFEASILRGNLDFKLETSASLSTYILKVVRCTPDLQTPDHVIKRKTLEIRQLVRKMPFQVPIMERSFDDIESDTDSANTLEECLPVQHWDYDPWA